MRHAMPTGGQTIALALWTTPLARCPPARMQRGVEYKCVRPTPHVTIDGLTRTAIEWDGGQTLQAALHVLALRGEEE